MRIFGNVEPLSESTSSFECIIIFQKWQSLEIPISTPGEDRHTHSRSGRKLNSKQLSFYAFFDVMLIFGSVEP